MELGDILAIAISLLILGGAVFYIIRAKKKGVRCIGCPHGASCAAAKNGGCPCTQKDEK